MTENFRQETSFSLGGATYKVRPEFAVIAAVEAATNQAAYALGMKFLSGSCSLLEVATVVSVLSAAQPGGAPAVSLKDAGEVLMDEGYQDQLEPLGLFLVRAMRGNREHTKEMAAKAAKAKEGAGAGAEGPPQDA